MSLNLNMVALRHISKVPISLCGGSNASSSYSASSLFLNFPTFSFCSRKFLKNPLIMLGNSSLQNHMSSLSSASVSAAEESINDSSHAPQLTKHTANTLVMKLTSEERTTLLNTLQQFESEQLKAEYKGQLAAFRWRTKLGRPSKVPRLGDVDPTGSYCPVPEDWLMKKYAETIPKPTTPQLFGVAVHNAVPFIGFGFLDNFLMIICGDYIELTLGSFMTISTMAAAALGNTFSDVLGLGCASYVEAVADKIGVKAPPLSPIQLDMKSSRMCANVGRGIGVTIGCLLGMLPLLFMKNKEPENKDKDSPDGTQEP